MAGGANPQMTQSATGQGVTTQSGQPVTGAGPTTYMPTPPTQLRAGSMNYARMNPYQQAATAQSGALGRTTELMDYSPERVQAATLGTPATAASQMQNYQNPYEGQVVQQTLRDIGTQAQLGQQNLAAQAQKAKSFGGSRHGVAQAQGMQNYTQQMADAASRMRQQGFNTALGAAQFDVGQQQQAAIANQAALNQASQLNQSAGLQGANLNLQAANQLGALGGRSFGYGEAIQDRQMQQGAMQRQMMQNLINQGQGSFGQMTGAPMGLQSFLSGVYGAPNMAGQSQSFQPGLFNYMQLGAQMMPRGPY